MATRGWEAWTEADVARVSAERGQKTPTANLKPAEPAKGHKYRAEPCIVTPDLTLFRKSDIQAAAQSVTVTDCGVTVRHFEGPLKGLAARCGIVGEWFGSLKEGRCWIELRQLEIAGEISKLERQPRFELLIEGRLTGDEFDCGCYVADFLYWQKDGPRVILDVKGVRTPIYKLKKKIVEALYDITITER